MPSPSRALLLSLALLFALTHGCSKRRTAWPGPAANSAVEEARKLLTEAGFEFGNGFPKLELLYNSSEAHRIIAAAVQEMWRQNLAIDVDLRNTEWKVYMDKLTAVDYQIARRGWIADYTDPNTFLDMFISESGNSNTRWSHAGYDRLIEEAARTHDLKARAETLQRAEAILMDELPVFPIYFYATQCMWRASVTGLHDNLLNSFPLKEVAHEGGERPFVMNTGAEPQTLDPNIQRGQPEHRISMALFEGLTTYDPRTLEPKPGVAESWTVTPDGRIWTFKLRDSKWSNDRPVTAHDFVYAWRRHINPAVGSDYAYIVFSYLRHGKSYVLGASADGAHKDFARESARELSKQVQARHLEPLKAAAVGEKNPEIKALLEKALVEAPKRADVGLGQVGVRAVDESTLVVELENPCPYFLLLTAFFSYYPIPREAVEKHGDRWTRPENIVTNGPFVMKEWKVNDYILVERNPRYWDAARVRQKQIKFLPQDKVSTAFTMFKAGQCDFLDSVPLEFVDTLQKDSDFHSRPYLATYYYSFNVRHKPLDDKRVRRALALAVDREAIVGKILRGKQTPAYSVVPPMLPPYEPQAFYRKSGPH